MTLAYIDLRPWIMLGVIPLLFLAAWLWRRLFRSQVGYWTLFSLFLFGFLTLAQFILYGPFIGQSRMVETPATWRVNENVSEPVAEFHFTQLPFQSLATHDRDVIAHLKNVKSGTVTMAVELTYDFGKVSSMDLTYAYVDGILFRPE
jgi:hypothetical protein